jgi:antitoxin component of MazEF toxin-antitoxin module
MQTQTVFKAGNSNVVAIPKSLGDKYGISHGKKVVVDEIPDVGIVIRRAVKAKPVSKDAKVDLEFQKWLEGAMKEDAEILDKLA